MSQITGNGHADFDLLPPPAEHFAEQIKSHWHGAAASIVAAGRVLIEAKAKLEHGEFGRMIDEQLPFGPRTAQRLMAIAEHPVLSNATHASQLPPSWMTLYELTKLPDEELEKLLATGKLNSELQRKDIEEITKKLREEGLYIWSKLDDALKQVMIFVRGHPDPSNISRHLGFGMVNCVSSDDLPAIAAWIEALHRAALRDEEALAQFWADEEAAEEAAQQAAEAERVMRLSRRPQRGKKRHKRPRGLAFHRTKGRHRLVVGRQRPWTECCDLTFKSQKTWSRKQGSTHAEPTNI